MAEEEHRDAVPGEPAETAPETSDPAETVPATNIDLSWLTSPGTEESDEQERDHAAEATEQAGPPEQAAAEEPEQAAAETAPPAEAPSGLETNSAPPLHRQPPPATPPPPPPAQEIPQAPPPPAEEVSQAPPIAPPTPVEEEPSPGPQEVDFLDRAMQATRRREEAPQQSRDYRGVSKDIRQHVARGYDLLGLVGYSGSGKTHFLRALSLLLRKQGFELADFERLRKALVPGFTEASVFDYPATGPRGEKWVFVDAGGELYARLHTNNWELAESSAALLHSLHHCRGLFLLVHLQQGHFRLSAAGAHRWMNEEQLAFDRETQDAQEELDFLDRFLLFLRALMAEDGDVQKLTVLCAEAPNLDRALRSYRDRAPKLDIPVMVLFTQADSLTAADWEIAPGITLGPRREDMDVMALVARHLPELLGTLLKHTRRFKFDFVQSYEEIPVVDPPGEMRPLWEQEGELLSCGALPAMEFLARNLPAKGRLGRLLQRLELDTRQALKLDRLLHRKRWRGVEVQL